MTATFLVSSRKKVGIDVAETAGKKNTVPDTAGGMRNPAGCLLIIPGRRERDKMGKWTK